MKNIEVVLCDLGNVLCPVSWDPAIQAFARELSRDKSSVKLLFDKPDFLILWYEFSTGRISISRFVKRINEFLKGRLDAATIRQIWCSIFTVDNKMLDLLKILSQKYRTFILSDTDTLHWDHLNNKHGLDKIVQGTILSFRRGNIKTDPGAFDKIAADYKFCPDKTVFIDDTKKNIEAAQRAGFNCVLHKSYEATALRLKEFGVI